MIHISHRALDINSDNDMGASGSKSDEDRRNSAIRAKVKAITAFNPVTKNRRLKSESTLDSGMSRREELLNFIKERREEKIECWEKLQQDYLCDSKSGDLEDSQQTESPVVEDVILCSLCGDTLLWEHIPCRACGRKYHRKCLISSKLYTDKEIEYFKKAQTNIGWSCITCDNIFTLLTPTELDDLSNDFDLLDVNKDGRISLDEYLSYEKKSIASRENGRKMTSEEEEFEKLQFKYLDTDAGGTIEYNEFISHHSSRKLSKRPKEELVSLLYPLEIASARKVFDQMDENRDGYINQDEVQYYRTWYTRIFTDLVDKGKLDLTGFLQHYAIYIISSRVNWPDLRTKESNEPRPSSEK